MVKRSRGCARLAACSLLTLVAVSSTQACELLYPLDGLAIGPEVGGFDASSDASSDAPSDVSSDLRDDQPVTITNLVPNGDFEMNTATACTGWASFQGTTAPSSTAHGGQSACLICSKASGDFSGGVIVLAKPVPAGTYVGTAWAKAAGGNANSLQVTLNLRVLCDPPTPLSDCYYAVTSVPLGAAYTKLGPLTFVVPDARGPNDAALGDLETHLSVNNDASPGDCFLVDDVVVERVLADN